MSLPHGRTRALCALVLVALLPAVLLGPATASAQRRSLVVTPYERKFKIAIQPFVGDSPGPTATGSRIAQVISSDLDFTGIFQPLNPNAFLEDARKIENIDFAQWQSIGAEALVKGSVTPEDGFLRVKLRPGEAEVHRIPQALLEQGLRLKQFKLVEVTLEDAFLKLTKGEVS